MVYYMCKDITPLKVVISKLLFEEQKRDNNNNYPNIISPYFLSEKKSAKTSKSEKSKKSSKSSKNKKKNQSKSVKEFPPKKAPSVMRRARKNDFESIKDKNQIRLIDITKKRKHSIKNKAQKERDGSVNSDRVRKRKSIIDYQTEMSLKTRENMITDSDNKEKKVKFNDKDLDRNKYKNIIFDNYELNNMDYYDASQYDKRSCLKTYWSVLLREHYVIFTFISRNDYNLFYIKIERFFILICTEVTMNGLFFVHETMYKKQTGDTSFSQKIPQIIFSLLVTHAVEIILCYLSMTDKHYYEIKALPYKEKDDQRIFDILDCMKRKLTGFFIFTFLFFLFQWYFISAFCAVYQNTQLIYLRDSAISILTSLVDPFIVYGITCLLRALSLAACCKKKLSCVYKLSDIIPFF